MGGPSSLTVTQPSAWWISSTVRSSEKCTVRGAHSAAKRASADRVSCAAASVTPRALPPSAPTAPFASAIHTSDSGTGVYAVAGRGRAAPSLVDISVSAGTSHSRIMRAASTHAIRTAPASSAPLPASPAGAAATASGQSGSRTSTRQRMPLRSSTCNAAVSPAITACVRPGKMVAATARVPSPSSGAAEAERQRPSAGSHALACPSRQSEAMASDDSYAHCASQTIVAPWPKRTVRGVSGPAPAFSCAGSVGVANLDARHHSTSWPDSLPVTMAAGASCVLSTQVMRCCGAHGHAATGTSIDMGRRERDGAGRLPARRGDRSALSRSGRPLRQSVWERDGRG
mmetsp:Transcript_6100/g.18731  ORF Transcript_6100/g.18731 Transcript_6100/m.18731 type:complete len:343 (+) Transcript_6100:3136-4164(+)